MYEIIHFLGCELNNFSNIMDYIKRQQQIRMAEEMGKRTDLQTMQMLVQASLRREAEAREREDKLLALLDRLSK